MPAQFSLSSRVVAALARIERSLGRLEGLSVRQPQPLLRKRNRVRSVHASSAIEGNALTPEQVTAVLDGKRVLGNTREVREIVNVNAAYEALPKWRATSSASLLRAHRTLMTGLAAEAGRFRTSGVGVFRGRQLRHMAPPAHLVQHHVATLLGWLARTDTPTLVKGCVVHYELLFIHPFLDGNGRLSRLWQQVIHRSHSEILKYVPVESIIRERQRAYYEELNRADRTGDCTGFVEFALTALADALAQFEREVRPTKEDAGSRLARIDEALGRSWFTRAAYLALNPRLSTASASRDLAKGVADGTLERRGERRLAEYRLRR